MKFSFYCVRRLLIVSSQISLLAVVFNFQSAQAQVLGLFGYVKTESDVNMNASVDPATRKWIDSLAPEIRTQMVAGIKEILPLIGQQADILVDHVDVVMSKTVDNAACKFGAQLDRAAKDLVIFGKQGNNNYLNNISDAFKNREGSIVGDPTAIHIFSYYSDYVLSPIKDANCLNMDPLSIFVLDAWHNVAAKHANVWAIAALEINSPQITAQELLAQKYNEVKTMIEKADGRDLEIVQATERFSQVTPEPNMSITDKVINVVKPRWVMYEDQLLKLQEIQDTVLLAKLARVNRAWMEKDQALQEQSATVVNCTFSAFLVKNGGDAIKAGGYDPAAIKNLVVKGRAEINKGLAHIGKFTSLTEMAICDDSTIGEGVRQDQKVMNDAVDMCNRANDGFNKLDTMQAP